MNSNPTVSVIIPAFNSEAHLSTAIDSVFQQTFTDFELFIVDDGSTDRTHEIALDYKARHPERCFVLQHPNKDNHGVAESRNLAAGKARGTYLAFLDADDRWTHDKLEHQAAHMESRPDTGLSWTRARIHREGKGEAFIPGTEILGDTPETDLKQAAIKIIQVATNYIFSSVMVRAEAFHSVNGFPEKLPHQSEDRLMVAKVAAHHSISMVDEVLCEYLAHDASYSSGVLHDRMVPVVFYDMQARYILWLNGPGDRQDWSRDMALALLPVYFAPALFCKFNRETMGGVMEKTREVLTQFPDMKSRFYLHALCHTRPGLFLLRLIRGKANSVDKQDDQKQPSSPEGNSIS